MGLFGNETVYSVSVCASKVFQEDTFEAKQKQLILSKVRNNGGIRDYLLGFFNLGLYQYIRYLNYGKSEFWDKLPTGYVNVNINEDNRELTNKIYSIIGTNTTILSINYDMIGDNDLWCKYALSTQYSSNYNLDINEYVYDKKSYSYTSCIINDTSATTCIAELKRNPDTTLQDEKTVITKFKKNIDEQQTVNGVTTTVSVTHYYKTTKIYRRTLVVSSLGTILNELSYSLKSSKQIEITKDDYDELEETTTYETVYNQTYTYNNTIQRTIPYHQGKRYYQIFYYDKSTKTSKWIILSAEQVKYTPTIAIQDNLEFLPIATLRRGKVDINSEQGKRDYPGRLENTQGLLKTIGLDAETIIEKYSENNDLSNVTDSHFVIQVSCKNTKPIVSKVIYETVMYLLNTYPSTLLQKPEYTIHIDEWQFNSNLYIHILSNKVVSSTLPDGLGSYKHEIISSNRKIVTTSIKNIEIKKIQDYPEEMFSCTTQSYSKVDVYEENGRDIFLTYYTTIESNSVTYYKAEQSDWEIENQEYDPYKEQIFHKEESSTGYNYYPFCYVKKQITKNTVHELFLDMYLITHVAHDENAWAGLDDDWLLLPIATKILDKLTPLEQCALVGESCYLTFYAVKKTTLQWYQTAAFGAFLKILSFAITAVVTFFSAGSGTVATMSLTEFLTSMITTAAIGIGSTLALNFIAVAINDPIFKTIASIGVLVVVAFASGSLSLEAFTTESAMTLTKISIQASQIYMDADIRQQMKQYDFNALSERYNERMETINKAFKSLNTGISTEVLTNIIVNGSNNNNILNYDPALMSVSDFIYLSTDYIFDLDNTLNYIFSDVHNLVYNQTHIGIGG